MDSNEKQISFRLDGELHQQFKKLCIDENKSIKNYVIELIEKELKTKQNKG